MKFFNILLISFCLNITLANTSHCEVPTFETKFETTPIPAGIDTTDDTAIWVHPTTPEKSLIIGVNKNKPATGGKPGVGIYDLQGKLVKYIQHDRLNNIDIRYNIPFKNKTIDLVMASNRDKKGLSLFEVKEGKITLLQDIVLKTLKG